MLGRYIAHRAASSGWPVGTGVCWVAGALIGEVPGVGFDEANAWFNLIEGH
jgi:hypothetical protein